MEENKITVEENRMKKHVNIAAILQIVFGSVNLIIALMFAVFLGFIDQVVDDQTAIKILGFIGVPVIVIMAIISGAMIAGGIGMFSCRQWAMVLTLVMAALGLLNIPLGTLKGVYIIWVLVQTETIALFEKGCQKDLVKQ